MSRSERIETIEALVRQLHAELTHGIEAGEIGDTIEFSFTIPVSRTFNKGTVVCSFRSMAVADERIGHVMSKPKLAVS